MKREVTSLLNVNANAVKEWDRRNMAKDTKKRERNPMMRRESKKHSNVVTASWFSLQ